MNLFAYDPVDEKETCAAGAKSHAQLTARAPGQNPSLGEAVVSLVRAAETGPPSFSPRKSCLLGQRTSTRLSLLELRLAVRMPSHREGRPGHSHERDRVIIYFWV